MDLPAPPKYFHSPPVVFPSNLEASYGKNKDYHQSFGNNLEDPLCKLNLKETSDFVKSFPMANSTILEVSSAQRRREGVNSVVTNRRLLNVETPSTPGRPVFSFSSSSSSSSIAKRSFPSKWDDAEKWLISSSSCNQSPAHFVKQSLPHHECGKNLKKVENFNQPKDEVFDEKSRLTEEKISKVVSCGAAFSGACVPGDVLLKDKFTDDVELVLPNFRCSEPLKEGFFFKNPGSETMKDAGTEVLSPLKHRDVGTEMTPLGSSKTSRCPTPFKCSSPARHNTPANRSGPLALDYTASSTDRTLDISQLQECHLAKLQLGSQYDSITSNWSSREEEEEDVSKSLRHFETGIASRKSVSDSRAAAWEEEEKTKFCLRYQREEAKIQAWVNLQSAKAEAQSKKLEVKIQKMRSNLEEKLMKRMASVHRKAEEWRASARQEHTEQIQRAGEQARRMINKQNSQISGHASCSCFPCNKLH